MERLHARWRRLQLEQKIRIMGCGICLLVSGIAGWMVADTTLLSLAVPGKFAYVRPTETATPVPPSMSLKVTIPRLKVSEVPRPGRLGAVLPFFGLALEPMAVGEVDPPAYAQHEDRGTPSQRTTAPVPEQVVDLSPTTTPDTDSTLGGVSPTNIPVPPHVEIPVPTPIPTELPPPAMPVQAPPPAPPPQEPEPPKPSEPPKSQEPQPPKQPEPPEPPKEAKPPKEPKEPKEPKSPKEAKPPKEPKELKEPKGSKP